MTGDLRRVQIVAEPAYLAIYVGGVLSGTVPRSVGATVAHALLDAIGEPSEAEAIVRSLARRCPVTEEEDPLGRLVDLCACCLDRLDDHTDDTCPYLRARAFVAREGREETP